MKYILSIILLTFSVTAFSQVKLEGVIKDSLGSPLELANVIAINKATKSLDSYAITNNDGVFRLDLKKNTTYSIQASYIGMKSLDQPLQTNEDDMVQDFVLVQDNSLDDMAIQYPCTLESLEAVQGVSKGKARRYGKPFVELINKYVETNSIECPDDLLFKSVAKKSTGKIQIIMSIDKQIALEDIAQAIDKSFPALLTELEVIVNSCTNQQVGVWNT